MRAPSTLFAFDVKGEGRLAVCTRRQEAETAVLRPRGTKEVPYRVAATVPMVPRRHGVGCFFLQKSDKAFEVLAFPSARVTLEERALIVQAQRLDWRVRRIPTRKCRPCALQGAVDGRCGAADQRSGLGGRPPQHVDEQQHRARTGG